MSIMVAVGRGAGTGVLIKNAEALELMEKVDTIVIDKTGTLTEGKPKLVAVRTASGVSEDGLLQHAAKFERMSQHPLGAAIVAAAEAKGLALLEVENFDAPTGKGVTGVVEGKRMVIGNERIMTDAEIDTKSLDGEADRLRADGATVIFIARDGTLAGILAIADPIKSTTPEALQALKAAGLNIVMLTGDKISHRASCRSQARDNPG